MTTALEEIKTLATDLGKSWEEYKKTNDQKIADEVKKGLTDPLVKEKLAKMDAAMSAIEELKQRLEKQEVAIKRTGTRPAGGLRIKDRDGNEVDAPEDWNAERENYSRFLRKGQLSDKDRADSVKEFSSESKTMSVQTDPDGGFTVTADMSGRVVQKIFETSDVEREASVQEIGTDALEGTYDDQETNAAWVSEQGTRSQTGTPQIGKWRIPVHELYAMPAATQKLLDDSKISVEQWLAGKVADKFARTLNTAYVLGTGNGQPRGFLTYPAGTTLRTQVPVVNSGTNATFVPDKLFDVVYTLKAAYRARAKWATSRLSVAALRKLKDTQNRYLWEPSLQVGTPAMLLGYPMVEFADIPDPANGSLSAVFADWKEFYQVVKRAGIRVLRDPYTVKGFVLFYTTIRAGGDVLNTEAGVINQLS